MAHRSWRSLIGPLLATLLPLIAYWFVVQSPALDVTIRAPVPHFYIVSAASVLAAAFSIAIGIAGIRMRNIQVTSLSLAFTSLALIFLLHGLATPGLILGEYEYRVAAVAAQLSVTVTAAWLLVSTFAGDGRVMSVLARDLRSLLAGWVLLLVALNVAGLADPSIIEWLPVDRMPLRVIVTLVTLVLLVFSGARYWNSWRYSRFPLQMAVLYSTGYLSVSQLIMMGGEIWRLSWWIYHVLLLAAVTQLIGGLLRQYWAGGSIVEAVRGLLSTDLRERLERGIAPSVRALVFATEARDTYTGGHNLRVALLALRLGNELSLSPEQLRALGQGGVIHDVGKVEIPDAILNKPGPLTEEEREKVQRHPVTGYELCSHLGLMEEELQVIRNHHEKWDGTGYPDSLSGEQIPVLARVLAIADVFDAVTSSRSYRDAWDHDRAHRLIRDGSGVHFDPRCVEAWAKVNPEDIEAITEIKGFRVSGQPSRV